MPSHRSGKKIAGSHSTLIDAARPIVDSLRKRSEVTKIVLGEIRSIRPGRQRTKIVPTSSGFRLAVRGSASLQTLYVYTDDPVATSRAIEAMIGGFK